MDDIAILDRLNEATRFGPAGQVCDMDAAAVEQALARLDPGPVRAELARCYAARSFSDNRLVELSDTETGQGVFLVLMSTPYMRDRSDCRVVSLQAFRYRDAPAPAALQGRYPAPEARPVTLVAATRGIRSDLRFVACFPDSLLGQVPESHKTAFYFSGKFLEAFDQCVYPLLLRLWDQEAFADLRAATRAELAQAATTWVHLHEHFHSQTRLPISDFGHLKDTRLSGAFEELRVDLCALLSDLDREVGPRQARITADFILAFRLIYYGSSFDPARNYDAITSVALSNLLGAAGCLHMTSACQYRFTSRVDLQVALRSGLNRLCQAEARVADDLGLGPADAAGQAVMRQHLERFMRDLCRSPGRGPVQRGAFHQHHSGGSVVGDDLVPVFT